MIKFLYFLGVNLVKGLLPLAGLFSKKINYSLQARKIEKKLFSQYQRPKGIVYWFHCASLGEYEQAKPLIKYYQNKREASIFITFFSPSGYDKIKPLSSNNFYIGYLPLESGLTMQKLIAVVKPDYVFWIKYELWLVNLNTLFTQHIPVALVSATIDKNHFIFKFWAKPWKALLPKFSFIFTQNKISYDVLKPYNQSTYLAGDTRFDNIMQLAKEPYENAELSNWIGDNKVLILGSSWQEEEAIIAACANSLQGWKIIIAPHDISVTHLSTLENLLTKQKATFNLWGNHFVEENNILIINNIGLLSKLYQYADIAFVGGGFSNALHNILEPMAYGKFVITGPTIHKNWEAVDAESHQILCVVKNATELLQVLEHYEKRMLPEATFITNFVSKHCGATNLIVEYI